MDERYEFQKILKRLKKKLDAGRYWHTQGVMFTAASLAMAHGAKIRQAQAAGLLHDCAKCIPYEKQREMCKKYKIDCTELELAHSSLLHAKLGAYLAREKYGVKDPEVLSAIAWHTTGRPDMTVLEKIIYIADYIEPARDKAPNLESIRKAAFADLDECMYLILRDSVEYLQKRPQNMDPATEAAYRFYRALHETRREQAKTEAVKRV